MHFTLLSFCCILYDKKSTIILIGFCYRQIVFILWLLSRFPFLSLFFCSLNMACLGMDLLVLSCLMFFRLLGYVVCCLLFILENFLIIFSDFFCSFLFFFYYSNYRYIKPFEIAMGVLGFVSIPSFFTLNCF